MIKPPDLKNKEYPLLMYVYGGPGINTVNDSGMDELFLVVNACSKGYIVVSVDARGTGYRGKDFKHATYLQLGKMKQKIKLLLLKNW